MCTRKKKLFDRLHITLFFVRKHPLKYQTYSVETGREGTVRGDLEIWRVEAKKNQCYTQPNQKLNLQFCTAFFEGTQALNQWLLSLMLKTYFGEAGGEWIVLGDLEIEGWKRNSFAHKTFLIKKSPHDASICGAGTEAALL